MAARAALSSERCAAEAAASARAAAAERRDSFCGESQNNAIIKNRGRLEIKWRIENDTYK
jgi:hypothetical protein